MRRGTLTVAMALLIGSCSYPTATVADGLVEATLIAMDGYDKPCLAVTGRLPNVTESKIYCEDSDFDVLAVTDIIQGALPFTAVMYDESVFVVALVAGPDDRVLGILTTEPGDPWSVGLLVTEADGSILIVTTDTGTERLILTTGEAAVRP